jgi:hypothetical protein
MSYGSANATIDDYVMVMEELVANLTKEQNKKMDATAKQLEALVASITTMMAAFKGAKATPKTTPATNAAAATTAAPAANANRKAKQEAYRQRLLNAVTCTHCRRKHPVISKDKCWELPANAANRPSGWTLAKTA